MLFKFGYDIHMLVFCGYETEILLRKCIENKRVADIRRSSSGTIFFRLRRKKIQVYPMHQVKPPRAHIGLADCTALFLRHKMVGR